MIQFRFSIENPWSTLWDAGRSWAGKLFAHKAWEFQLYRSNVVAEFMFQWTHRQDHAGIKLEFGLFTWCFTIMFYDSRHWNYDKGCWELYDN